MVYYKDTNNNLYAFNDNIKQELIDKVAQKHNTKLFQITTKEYKKIKTPTLQDLKQTKKQEIEEAYIKAIQEPIVYNNNTFQADLDSQKILSQIIAVAPDDFEIDWLDIDNNLIHLTLDDLKSCAQLILKRGQEMFAKKVALKKQLEKAITKDEVNKITW